MTVTCNICGANLDDPVKMMKHKHKAPATPRPPGDPIPAERARRLIEIHEAIKRAGITPLDYADSAVEVARWALALAEAAKDVLNEHDNDIDELNRVSQSAISLRKLRATLTGMFEEVGDELR
jgi:hypothetical protein